MIMVFPNGSRKSRLLACALMLGVAVLAGCSARRSEQYRQEGDTYSRLGKYKEADQAYSAAIKANPQNAEAHLGHGYCLLKQNLPEAALAAYREAMRLDANLEKAYSEAARILLASGKSEEAEQVAQQFEQVNAEAGGILHAFVLREAQRNDAAVTLLEKLRDQSPKSVPVRINLAAAYLATAHPELAEKELKAILEEIDENSLSARMALVEVYQAQGKLPDIVAQLEAMVQRQEQLATERPDNKAYQNNLVGLKLALARSLLDSGRIQEAEDLAKPILERSPESGWANYIVGSCLLERGKYADAMPRLQAAAKDLPEQVAVARRLGTATRGAVPAKPGEPPAPLTPAAAGTPAPAAAESNDLATLWRKAALRRLVDDRERLIANGEKNVHETLALAALFTRNAPVAEQLAANLPAESPIRKYLAAFQAKDREALLALMKSWQQFPASDAEVRVLEQNALGFALAALGARAQALHVYLKCREMYPENAVALYNLSEMYRAAQMPQFAARCLQKLVVAYPDNMEARELLFTALADAGMGDEARTLAESTYHLFPNRRESILNLTQTYLDAGELNLAMNVLTRGMQTLPSDVELQIGLARALLYAGKPSEALDVTKNLTPAPGTELRIADTKAFASALTQDWVGVRAVCEHLEAESLTPPLRLIWAAALIYENRLDEAVARISDLHTFPATSRERVQILAYALGQRAEAVSPQAAALADALAGNPAALGAYAVGTAYLEERLYLPAVDACKQVLAATNGAPRMMSILAESLSRAKQIPDRLAIVRQEMAAKYPDAAEAWLALAMVAQAAGDVSSEREALDRAAALSGDNPDVWRRRALFFDRQQDVAQAADAYRHVLGLAPDDAYASNNLAYCLLSSEGDAQEALRLATAARDKLVGNPHILHTLGLAQLRTGDLQDSQTNLAIALEMRPGDPTMMLDMGQAFIALNRPDEGKKVVEQAIQYADQLGLDFPRRAEAEKILASG